MNVLVIPPSYFSQSAIGGGERYARSYSAALATLTPTTLGVFGKHASARRDGSLIVRTFSVRHYDQRWCFPCTPATAASISRFDILHVMAFPTPFTDLAIVLSKLRSTRVVLTDVGGGGACWSSRLRPLCRYFDLNRMAAGLAHLSNYAASAFVDWKQPSVVLHGGVPCESRPESQPCGYALFVGRLLPHKGVLELIEALSPKIPLRVVGTPLDPLYLSKLREAAKNKSVTFHLAVSDEELNTHYRSASVVVQPSLPGPPGSFDRSELLGLVALEGMSWGKPVVVTRTASLPELVIERRTGFIVPPHDAASLRSAVERLVCEPDLSTEMGRSARQHVLDHFTWKQAAQRGLALYQGLVKAGT